MELLRGTIVAVVGALAVGAASGRPAAQSAVPSPSAAAARIGVQGAFNAHVSLAARGMFVVAVWAASSADGATDIYSAVSRDGGIAFNQPVRVNTVRGSARVNGEQPPRVALSTGTGRDPSITVMWTASGTGGTRLLTAESRDGGTRFGGETLVPGTDAPGNRGWEALASDGTRTHAVWLDHRRLANRSGDKPHQHGQPTSTTQSSADGVATAQLSQLYFLTHGSGAPPLPITGGVCYCCKTAIATRGASTIHLAWRHVFPGNLRDIAFTTSRDGGRTFSPPVRVSEDKWAINGCPDDGPAMAVDARGRVHVVWPTVITERGEARKALFHAMSTDGRRFGPRLQVPTRGPANHPQIAIAADGSVMVAWDEVRDGARVVQSARGVVSADGTVRLAPAGSALEGTYPTLAPAGSGVVRAWTGPPPQYGIFVDRL